MSITKVLVLLYYWVGIKMGIPAQRSQMDGYRAFDDCFVSVVYFRFGK